MKKIYTIAVCSFLSLTSFAQDAKQVAECTITYSVNLADPKADESLAKMMNGATKTIYLKGAKSRTDLETSLFKQSVIYDTKTDSTVILKESGNNKYISYLSGSQRMDKNKKYVGIAFVNTNEHKTILGYDCKKVIAKLADGSSYNVYFTTAIVPSNNQYEYQFKDLPGVVLEYESEMENSKTRIKYVASRVVLSPVLNSWFDIPKSGYRVL